MQSYRLFCVDRQNGYSLFHGKGIYVDGENNKYMHYDSSLTLTYFVSCKGKIKIEGNSFEINDGDIVIMNPQQVHSLSVEDGSLYERYSIYLDEEIFAAFPFESKQLFDAFYKAGANLIPEKAVSQNGLDKIIEQIFSLAATQDNTSKILITCRIAELLFALNNAVVPISEAEQYVSENPTVKKVLHYINEHFKEDVSLESIAERFYLSKYRLEHIFKESVGVSLWEYVIIRRLIYVNILIKEKLGISEAAYEAGFCNYSNFYRLYKKHMNMTPQQYKKQLSK